MNTTASKNRVADAVFDELSSDDVAFQEEVIAVLKKYQHHFAGAKQNKEDGIYTVFWDDGSCNEIEMPFGVIINVKAGNYGLNTKGLH